MTIRFTLILLLFFITQTSFISAPLHGEWHLVTEKESMKVYKRNREGSMFKEVKIEKIFDASADDVIKELDDIESYVHWIYKCTESYTVKRLSDTEIVTYSLANLPVPVWDRDIVSYSKYSYNKSTRIHYYESYTPDNDESYVPVRKNVVRVKDYKATWSLQDMGNGKTKSINTVHMEPGGSIPAWLNNMAIAKGPVKTMEALQKRLDSL